MPFFMKRIFPVLQYLNVPNFVTTIGLYFGIAACYYLIQGSLRGAFICLFFAVCMDVIDGFSAGKLNQKTRFGQVMDSLVDFFVCCIMPVWMVLIFVGDSILLIASLMIYVGCGLWRLAHFTVMAAENQGKPQTHYAGLPVPGAMLLVSISVWAVVYYGCPPWLSAAVLLLSALAMASSFKLKKYGFMQKASWVVGLGFFVLVLAS